MSNHRPISHLPDKPCFVSVLQFCQMVYLTRSMFYRKLRKYNLPNPGGCISPIQQNWYCKKLGLPRLWTELPDDEE